MLASLTAGRGILCAMILNWNILDRRECMALSTDERSHEKQYLHVERESWNLSS